MKAVLTVIQFIICIVIPFIMWHAGRTYRNGNVAYGKEKGWRYKSKRAAASEEAWTYANDLYFNILRAAGFNVGLISAVLFIAVVYKTGHGWTIALSLIVIQLICGFVLPRLITERMLRRYYDADGVLIGSEEEETAEEEESSGNTGLPEPDPGEAEHGPDGGTEH